MKKSQIVKIVLYATIMFILLCTSVYATVNEDVANIDSLTAGQEFVITLYIYGNSSLSSEISSIEGYINIDENILEDLTVESIVTDSNGKVTINEDNVLNVYDINEVDESVLDGGIVFSSDLVTGKGDYKVLIDLNTPISITTKVDLFTIKFKVKSGVTPGTYEDAISYELFEMASQSSSSIIPLADYSIDLTIVSSSSSGSGNNVSNNNVNNANSNSVNNASNNINNNNSNNANNNSNNNVANNISNKNLVGSGITNSNSSNNQSDNTVASGSLPLAGYKVFILPLVIAAIAGLVFYKKYNQYKQF